MTLASELAAYIENLVISQGRYAGQKFKLLGWQKRYLRGAFKPGVMDAALSLARGGGENNLHGGDCGRDGGRGRAAGPTQG